MTPGGGHAEATGRRTARCSGYPLISRHVTSRHGPALCPCTASNVVTWPDQRVSVTGYDAR